jgi:hypothetical protein
MTDGFKETFLVKPVHPIEGLPLQGLDRLPGPLFANDFGLVKAIDGLCKRVVVAVSGTAHRRLDVCLSELLAVADGDVLEPLSLWWINPLLSGCRA